MQGLWWLKASSFFAAHPHPAECLWKQTKCISVPQATLFYVSETKWLISKQAKKRNKLNLPSGQGTGDPHQQPHHPAHHLPWGHGTLLYLRVAWTDTRHWFLCADRKGRASGFSGAISSGLAWLSQARPGPAFPSRHLSLIFFTLLPWSNSLQSSSCCEKKLTNSRDVKGLILHFDN